MQKLKQIYRSSYAGESIVSELILSNNEWEPQTEYVPNRVFNTHTTTQAVAVGNGPSRHEFNLKLIERHRGGLLAHNKLQSYACNLAHEEFTPDFLITTDPAKVKAVAESGYCDDHIVYSNAQYVLEYPGKFYLVPQNPPFDAGSLATYLACFDGHRKIFLLGFDGYTDSVEDVFWVKTLTSIMDIYKNVEFVRVCPTKKYVCANDLIRRSNFRQIDFREFVIEADIG
jgi:hypothetical protein